MKIIFSVDRFEGDKAILATDGFSVIWPKSKLPAGSHEGSSIVMEIKTDKDVQKNNQELAKDILNELLGSNH